LTADLLLQSKSEIQVIVADAFKDMKMATRKKAAVIQMHDSESVLKNEENLIRAQQPVSKPYDTPEPLDPGLDDDLPDFGTNQLAGTVG
jgi:hypothetical protein